MTATSQTVPARHRPSAVSSLLRGWRVFAPVVVLEAVAQALLVLPDPTPSTAGSFLLLLLASAAALLVGVAVTAAAAWTAAGGERPGWRAATRRLPALVPWTLAVGVVCVAVSLLWTSLVPLVLLLGAFVLPPAAAGDRPVLRLAWRPFARTPWRTTLAVIGALVLLVLSWLLALVLGFFLTGAPAALLTWLWFGLVAALVLCSWSTRYRVAREAAGPAASG